MMKSADFVETLKDIATTRKTLFIVGGFGAPLTVTNKTRYTKNDPYNMSSSRVAIINAAGNDTYGFDSAGLVKGVLWGWNGNKKQTYGGAVYASNNVPDLNDDDIFASCTDTSDDFFGVIPGEIVWLSGHVGVYIGEGKVVESTPSWDNGVQITKIGFATEHKTRKWTKHGKLPWIDYAEEIVLKPLDEIAAEVVEGHWGAGAYRKMRLTAAGYDFAAVQARVDEIIRANEGTLWTPKVGDMVIYHGQRHYASSNAVTGPTCSSGKAVIIEINGLGESAHPYYLTALKNSSSTVCGWVNADSFSKAES